MGLSRAGNALLSPGLPWGPASVRGGWPGKAEAGMLVALSWTGGRWDLVPTHPPWGAHVGRDPCTLRGARRREPPPPVHLPEGYPNCLYTGPCCDLERHPPVLGLSPLRPLPALVPAGLPAWNVPHLQEGGTWASQALLPAPPDSADQGKRSLTPCCWSCSISHCGGLCNCLPFSWPRIAGL